MEGGTRQRTSFLAAIVTASFLFVGAVGFALHHYRLEGPKSTLVSFPSRQVMERFLLANKLQENDLQYISALGAYLVPLSEQSLKSIEVGMSIAPNRNYKAMLLPNDPLYPQWYTDKVAAPAAWDITTGSSSVTVAVIDTGFALDHEDLASRWALNTGETGGGKETNNVDDDNNGYVDDWRGWDFVGNDNNPQAGAADPASSYASHGTIVAGLVGATGNNGRGVASVNWGAKLLPLQVLGDDGTGYTTGVASAVRYAADRGAKVISLSLGASEPDSFMRDQIAYARSKGAVVVAAAGNGGCDCMVYPANYPEVIAVGATDSNDNRAGFSSYGANLDIMAPGTGTLRSTYWSAANQTSSYTASASGTSMSTPIVSGVASLLFGLNTSLTPDEVAFLLANPADKLSGMAGQTRTNQYGNGRLNAQASLKQANILHPDGTLVHSSGTVYLIQDGQKRPIVSGHVFISNGYDWSRIKSATVADMQLPNGTPFNSYREGTLLHANGVIYVVDIDGSTMRKRPFSSWNAFSGLGYRLDEVLFVAASSLPAVNDSPITTDSIHPDGSLIHHDGSVYLLESGQKKPIASGTVFNSYGYNWGSIKPATTAGRSVIAGAPINYPREGTIVAANGGVHVIDRLPNQSYVLRGVSTWSTFLLLGFRPSEIIPVPAAQLPSQAGSPINFD